jgi:hypothetical protein
VSGEDGRPAGGDSCLLIPIRLQASTMAALLRQGARRIAGSVLQRTQAAVTSPAVAEERRRLVPRRMYSTNEVS